MSGVSAQNARPKFRLTVPCPFSYLVFSGHFWTFPPRVFNPEQFSLGRGYLSAFGGRIDFRLTHRPTGVLFEALRNSFARGNG